MRRERVKLAGEVYQRKQKSMCSYNHTYVATYTKLWFWFWFVVVLVVVVVVVLGKIKMTLLGRLFSYQNARRPMGWATSRKNPNQGQIEYAFHVLTVLL